MRRKIECREESGGKDLACLYSLPRRERELNY